jgi:protein-L-isoaspartate(D-aspartate) O-methyltransferase
MVLRTSILELRRRDVAGTFLGDLLRSQPHCGVTCCVSAMDEGPTREGEAHETLAGMVDALIADGAIQSRKVEKAFRAVERHRFLPDVSLDSVYGGEAVPIKQDDRGLSISSSSEPAIMAAMLEQLAVEQGHRVLEIGTGSGYNAALLAELVGETGETTSVDLEADLVEGASRALAAAGYPHVATLAGDGWEGVVERAPFDRIEVTVGAWDLSPHWINQLTDEGLLVVPLWLRAGFEASIAFRKRDNWLVSESVEHCGFMRLRGPHAGPEAYVAVNGWLACIEAAREDDVEVLRELFATEPREEEIPSTPKGWFERLAMEEAGTIRLVTRGAPYRDAGGVFDPEAHSVAVVEGKILRTYGGPEARLRLEQWLGTDVSFCVDRLRVEAALSGSLDARHGWVLARPEFTFFVTGGSCRQGPGLRYLSLFRRVRSELWRQRSWGFSSDCRL